MGLNRFSTVGQSEYTEQHVPLPFDTISKLGEQIKLEHDTADAAASAAKTDIQGGLATQEHAKALNAKKNALLKAAQERAEREGNYGRLTQDIKEIASTVQNDPLYQGIQRDIAMTKLVNQQRMDPNHPYVIQGYADEKGGVKQLGIDQPFDESYYNQVAPVDFYKDHSDVYNQIKEQSIKQGGPSTNLIYRTTYDAAGNELIQGFNQQNQKVREGIAPEDVAAFADRWIQDPRNMATRASVGYRDAYLKQKENRGYTPQEYRQDIINNFPGYREKITDVVTEKPLPIENAPRDGSGRSGGSGGGKTPTEVPNQFVLLADAKNTQATTPVLKDLGYAPGPNDVPGSYMVNLDGSDGQPAIVNFAKVTPDNPQANNIVNYGNALNNLRKTTGIEDNETFIEKLRSQHPENLYRIVNGNIELFNLKKHPGSKFTQEQYQNQTGEVITAKDATVPVDVFKESYIKTTDEYKILEDEAKENGVNISDPNFKNNYLKTLGVKTIQEAQDMGQMLNIKGDYPFILKDGNNKTNVGDKAFLDGYIILTKDQIDAEMANKGLESNVGATVNPMSLITDDWEELFLESHGGNGMVQPYAKTRDGVEQYKIPIKKPIQISQIANQNYNSSFYGATVTGKESQHHAETFNDWQAKGINARRDKVYGQSYTSNPTGFKNNITANISSNKELAPETKGELFKVIEELKNNPRATKETWVAFKAALETDGPETFLENLKNGNVQTNPPGKSTGGWSQTPATPLK